MEQISEIYSDSTSGDQVIRRFSETIDPFELKWHRDAEDRHIVSTEVTDWKLQTEDCLPIGLNSEVYIPSGVWHRLIKGTGDLTLKIIKN
jgi:hypothetical protein